MSDASPSAKRKFQRWKESDALARSKRGVSHGMRWLWGRVPKSFEELRKLMINLLLVGAVGLMGLAACNAVSEDLTIVEAITIPKSLEDKGYSGAIISQRLIDEFEYVSSTARTRVGRAAIGRNSRFSALASIEVPSADISVQAVISLLRGIFRGEDDRIGGEIVVTRPRSDMLPEEYELRLRFNINRDTPQRPGGPQDHRYSTYAKKSEDLDKLIRLSAERIVEQTNPTVLASYFYSARRWNDLDPLLERLRVSKKREIGPRAEVLYGMRLLDRRNFDEALRVLAGASSGRHSMFAVVKYAEALTATGNPQGAVALYKEAHERDYGDKQRPWTWFYRQFSPRPANPLPFPGWAAALAQDGKPGEAQERLAYAVKHAVADPRVYVQWGDLLRDDAKPNFGAAEEKYLWAVRYEPRNWAAYTSWGILLARTGNMDSAIEKFDMAIQADRFAAEPHYQKGKIYLGRGDYAKATKAFQKSTELDAEFAPGFIGWAETLYRQSEFDAGADKQAKALRIASRGFDINREWQFGTYE